jgi:NTE family protein
MDLIKTLVFEGGSVKGLAYVGALNVLEAYSQCNHGRPFLNQEIIRVAGTSAGAIMALLIALGLDIQEINLVMKTTTFSNFEDVQWYARGSVLKGYAVYSSGYLCEGEKFMDWVKDLIASKLKVRDDLSFSELLGKTGKHLHVYAVRLNDNRVISFNPTETPKFSVALAIRMSMSIPVFFKPVRVQETCDKSGYPTSITLDHNHGDTYYVDGGVKLNYPYSFLKNKLKLADSEMLGFKVDSALEILANARDQPGGEYLEPLYRQKTQIIHHGMGLIPCMIAAMMSNQDDSHNWNTTESKRTIHCDDCGVNIFDFDLKDDKKTALMSAGESAAMTFIKGTFPSSELAAVDVRLRREHLPFASSFFEKQAERDVQRADELKRSIESTRDNVQVKEAAQLKSTFGVEKNKKLAVLSAAESSGMSSTKKSVHTELKEGTSTKILTRGSQSAGLSEDTDISSPFKKMRPDSNDVPADDANLLLNEIVSNLQDYQNHLESLNKDFPDDLNLQRASERIKKDKFGVQLIQLDLTNI